MILHTDKSSFITKKC